MLLSLRGNSEIRAYFRFGHFVPIRLEKEFNSVHSSFQCCAVDQKSKQQNVRNGGSEVNDFSGRSHGLPEAKVNNDPGNDEQSKKLQSDAAKVVDSGRKLQNFVTEMNQKSSVES